MTVSYILPYSSHVGNGSELRFDFNYYAFNKDWVKIKLSTGEIIESVTVINADQQGNPGGYITFEIPPANGVQVYTYRQTPVIQDTDYPVYGQFPSASHERALDTLTLALQETAIQTNTAIRARPEELGTGFGYLPPANMRVNKLLGFDENAQVKVFDPTGGDFGLTSDNISHDGTTVGAELRSQDKRISSNTQKSGTNANAIRDQDVRISSNTQNIKSNVDAIENQSKFISDNAKGITSLDGSKADKSIEIKSSNTNLLTIQSPTLDSDVNINIRSNLPLALCQLDNSAMVRPSQLPFSGIQTQGGFLAKDDESNPSVRFPNVIFESGDMVIMASSGGVEVIDHLTQSNTVEVVAIGDMLIYTDETSLINVVGWYYYPTVTKSSIAAVDVLFDNSNTVYDGSNLQVLLEEQSKGHLWRYRDESTDKSLSVGANLGTGGNIRLSGDIHFKSVGSGIFNSSEESIIMSTDSATIIGHGAKPTYVNSSEVMRNSVAGGDAKSVFVEEYNVPTSVQVGADPAGTADEAVLSHKSELNAHTPANVGAESAGAVDAHNIAPTVHSVATVSGLQDSLNLKFNASGGTIFGPTRIEGDAIATGDVVGFEGT